MIDLHSHILPGIDDGAPDMAGAVAMARQARACGIRKVVATPHVDSRHDNRAATIKTLVAALNDELARQSIDLEVLPGAEIAAHRLADLDESELAGLGLGGGPYLLIEAPLSQFAGDFEVFMHGRGPGSAQSGGHGLAGGGGPGGSGPEGSSAGGGGPGAGGGSANRYVLAHPERSPVLQRDPERLRRLVLGGTVVSITAGALSGRFGGTVRRFAISLLEQGMVHNVASDMHDLRRRPPGISEHLDAASKTLPGIAAIESWLTREVPEAVIAGRSVEMPPLLDRRRQRLGLRRLVPGLS